MKRCSVPARPTRAKGFTLLEIMVAMLLLAVIVTTSVSLLFINIRGWDALVSDSDRSLGETLISNRLVDTLHELSPLVWRQAGERRLAFSGEPERLHFISRAPMQARTGGFFEYLLTAERDSEGRSELVLYYAPYYPGQTEFRLPDAGARRVLFSDTGAVNFSYWGLKKRGDKEEWSARWEDDLETYPNLMRISLAGSEDGEGARNFYVRPLIDALKGQR